MRIRHQDVFGLGAIDQVAEAPACGEFVAMATAAAAGYQVAPVLRRGAVLRSVAVEVGADSARNDTLAFLVARHGAAQFDDHAHRFVSDRQAFLDWVLALEDVDVGAANRRRGDFDQRIVGAHIWNRLVGDFNASGCNKDGGFHHLSHKLPFDSRVLRGAQGTCAG